MNNVDRKFNFQVLVIDNSFSKWNLRQCSVVVLDDVNPVGVLPFFIFFCDAIASWVNTPSDLHAMIQKISSTRVEGENWCLNSSYLIKTAFFLSLNSNIFY